MKTKAWVLAGAVLALTQTVPVDLVQAQGSVGGSGQNCGEQPDPNKKQKDPNKQQANIFEMSGRLRDLMVQNDAKMAIVSRAGGKLDDRKFKDDGQATPHKYTHAGILYRTQDGAWRFIHLLNTCAGPTSDIFEQKMPEFFVDDPHFYDVIVTIPSLELQERILQVIYDRFVGSKGWARSLHNPRYSNIANPFALSYQNSNQWALTVIAAAQSDLKAIELVQEFYQRNGFVPTKVKLGLGERIYVGGGGKDNAKTDDHPPFSGGWFNFVSALSVHNYLNRSDRPLVKLVELCHPRGCKTLVSDLE